MDALEQAKQNMEFKEGWRDKANNEADQEMYDEHVRMEDICRADAVAYAAIAQAEAAQRQAAALERIADALYYTGASGTTGTVAETLSALTAAHY